ncbi:MAG: hypothetical protein Q8P22_04865, partial [Chloroflexota bacterium]|nr:hypothetical protein [Chloroflexota bacterium]
WSPDGQRIAWASDRNGNFDIYIANADGSEATRLTASPVDELSPRWSPEGERIAFSRLGEIMVMNSDGSATRQLTEMEPESTAAPCKAGGFLGGWSPDGTQLTFYTASISQGSGQICIVDADGLNLTVVKADPDAYHVEPAWSPLDRRIAYRSVRQDNHEVYVVNADGSDDMNLTGSPATDIEPAWSPDGRWIAFASDRDGNFEIYIMRSDGSEVTRLTDDAAKDSVPAWGAPRPLALPGPTTGVRPVDMPELPEQPTVSSLPTPASIATVQMPTLVSSPTIEVPTTVPPSGTSGGACWMTWGVMRKPSPPTNGHGRPPPI